MGGSILRQGRGRVLLTCYSLYCTVDFTQKKPEWSVLYLLSQEKYKHTGHTGYPLWVCRYSKPLTLGYCILRAQLISDNLCHSNAAVWQAEAHTDKYDRNSCMVSDPHQSDHCLVTTAAVTGCPTCLRWIKNNHSLLDSGNSCWGTSNITQIMAIKPHTHFLDGCIFHTWKLSAHRGAACWPIQSLIPWKCLEIMYDQVSPPLEKQGTQQNIWKWDTQPARL